MARSVPPLAAPLLEQVVEQVGRTFAGPGGAVAVLRQGEVLIRRAWGWANAERRIPFTPKTLFRMCSITKQFTCATVLSAFPDPTVLDADVRARLPGLETHPNTLQLCHNQSGLRDYWAFAMLHGAPDGAPFGDWEAGRVIAGARTLHFQPGTRYSYCNQNFRILSDILQERTGRTFAELLRTHIFDKTGMDTAALVADTRAMPDGTEGYDGSPQSGHHPAVNRVIWTGDAGLTASLDDMIAWERQIDATRDDPDAIYSRLTRPVTFTDGTPAGYGFGLNRRTEFGGFVTGHGGALRGWRSHRLYAHAERISVVVMFNHLSDAQAAASDLLYAALGQERPGPDPTIPQPPWLGTYQDPETNLAVRVEACDPGQVLLRYVFPHERLDLNPDGSAGKAATILTPTDEGLRMRRPLDNSDVLLRRTEPGVQTDIIGIYRCAELDPDLTIAESGGMLYAAFSGFLGAGRMEELTQLSSDLYQLPCLRALDYTPPGEWTLQVRRDPVGAIAEINVGTWLARNLAYRPVVNS